MLSNDSSGIFGWLIGLVVIVMVGVGLSIMVDRRFQFSSNNKEIQSVIDKEAEQLRDLVARLPRSQEKFENLDHPRQLMAREADELKLRLPINRSRIQKLKTSITNLKSAISSQEESLATYQKAYRAQIWREAVGEKHAELLLKTGRRYETVSIQRVTPVGLEITHKDGLARIDFTELDQAWRERFQWQFEERQSTIEGEASEAAAPNPPTSSTSPPPQSPTPSKPDQLDKLRSDVVRWNSKVSMLKTQYQEARANVGSKQNSPPGSLETWAQRANRLAPELSQATMKRELARLKLADADPNDPLAKPYPSDY